MNRDFYYIHVAVTQVIIFFRSIAIEDLCGVFMYSHRKGD